MDNEEFSQEAFTRRRADQEAKKKADLEAAINEDPEIRALHMETKQVQKDTLVSTQNSVRAIKDTIVVADKTSSTLKDQGRQLDEVEKKATEADTNASDAYQSSRDLHKYKGILPVSIKNAFTGSKKREEDSKLAKTTKKLDREEGRIDKQAEENKPNLAATPKGATDYGGDESERQINENLDEISAGLDHLQMQATSMNEELNRQNVTIQKVQATTDHTDYTIKSADRKIQEFM